MPSFFHNPQAISGTFHSILSLRRPTFWSGSTTGRTDRTVDLTAADGTRLNDVPADRCVTVNNLGGFLLPSECNRSPQKPGWRCSIQWDVLGGGSGRVARADSSRRNCLDAFCQAKYAAWSLVLVYRSATARTIRDVFIHDGFRNLMRTKIQPCGPIYLSGFDFPDGGDARLTFFGLEGDSFLGVPPQDTDPFEPCDTCFDYLAFNGTKLSDALNPPNNLFNSSSPGGFTLGLDLDIQRIKAFDGRADKGLD